jgi:putative ubiquitin-RnfH superfamily antitoxin RatB of RatAB toxin-antitoxin module
MNAMPDSIRVEVVFATPDRQEILAVEAAPGISVSDAIAVSGIQELFPERLDVCATGVWGNRVPRNHVLENGDRVEIYRELARDPMDARRELAKAQRLGSSS